MKKGKIFGINIIDILITIAVLGVIAGIFVRFGLTNSSGIGNSRTIEYTVKIDNVRSFTVEGLEKLGEVFAEKTNVKIGEITNVSSEPYKEPTVTIDGKRELFEKPDRYTVYVTVKSDVTENSGAFYNGDKETVGVGREGKICTKYVSTNGKIINLNTLEK